MTDELMGTTVSGWLITGYLGCGKSALVLKAEQNGNVAALKIFDPDLVERFGKRVQIARIDREKSLIGQLHPNLVEILDGGECSRTGYLFVAMRLIESPNMFEAIRDIPRDKIGSLMSDVATAAAFLEKRGLVHRDIKPDNIAVTADYSKAILLDLGVLRPVGTSGLTDNEEQAFVGTHQYGPPEFLLRKEEDSVQGWQAVTFYQLGAVLHDLIMRTRIFAEQSTPLARLVEAVQHDVPLISSADVSPELTLLAKNCLLKSSMQRLRLVSWESFTTAALTHNIPSTAKESVRRIQEHVAASNATIYERGVDEDFIATRLKLVAIQAAIQTMVRDEAIASGHFPPLEIREIPGSRRNDTDALFLFAKSETLGLRSSFSFKMSLTLVDTDESLIRLSCISYLGLSADEVLKATNPPEIIFEGVFLEEPLKQRIFTALYLSLERALNVSDDDLTTGTHVLLPLLRKETDK